MKYRILFVFPIALFGLSLTLISESCGDAGNKKAESPPQQSVTQENTGVSSATTEAPTDQPSSATEANPKTTEEQTSTLKRDASLLEKSKTGNQTEKNKPPETSQSPKVESSVVPVIEQPRPNPTIPAKQEAKKEEGKVNSPPPVPVPVVVEKPKENTQVPATDPGKWVVPSKDKSKQNPIKADAASLELGKSLYVKHCASCHGKKGHGDGSKAAQLDTKCGDFALPAFKNQTDGAMFYKIMQGRDDMPAFKKKLPDQDDIWSIVNYIKTL